MVSKVSGTRIIRIDTNEKKKKQGKPLLTAITPAASISARPDCLRINEFNVVRQDEPSHPKDVIAVRRT